MRRTTNMGTLFLIAYPTGVELFDIYHIPQWWYVHESIRCYDLPNRISLTFVQISASPTEVKSYRIVAGTTNTHSYRRNRVSIFALKTNILEIYMCILDLHIDYVPCKLKSINIRTTLGTSVNTTKYGVAVACYATLNGQTNQEFAIVIGNSGNLHFKQFRTKEGGAPIVTGVNKLD